MQNNQLIWFLHDMVYIIKGTSVGDIFILEHYKSSLTLQKILTFYTQSW